MTKKTILITGCSSGIGYDAAHGLEKHGWRVFATCRADEDCEQLRDEGLESFQLDYRDESSIEKALAEVLHRTGGTLDALFNNGAYALPGAVEDLPRGAFREIFETNLFGVHDLTQRVVPLMRTQGHGRIVNCSSILGLVAGPFRGAYNSTKFAMEGLTDTMRIELRGSGIDVCLIEPGPVTSKIRQNAIGHFERWVDWENSSHKQRYIETVRPRLYDGTGLDRFELPASAVTRKLLHAISARRPRARYYVTTPTYLMGSLRRILSTRMLDRVLSRG